MKFTFYSIAELNKTVGLFAIIGCIQPMCSCVCVCTSLNIIGGFGIRLAVIVVEDISHRNIVQRNVANVV